MKENNEKEMPKIPEKEREALSIEIKKRLTEYNAEAFRKCDTATWIKHIAFKFGDDGEILIRIPSVFTPDNEFLFCIALVRINIPEIYKRQGIGTELINIMEEIAATSSEIDGVVLEQVNTLEMKSLALKCGYKKDPRIIDVKDGLFVSYYKLKSEM